MTVVLCRVDDRLIHGQVVIGWGQHLHADRIVLVDDAVAAAPWEQDLYRLAVPPQVAVEFVSAAEAAGRLDAWERTAGRTILLTADVGTMAALHAAAPGVVRAINLGGIHAQAGRRERVRYVFLSEDEYALLQRLAAAGADVTAQDVPSAPARSLESLA